MLGPARCRRAAVPLLCSTGAAGPSSLPWPAGQSAEEAHAMRPSGHPGSRAVSSASRRWWGERPHPPLSTRVTTAARACRPALHGPLAAPRQDPVGRYFLRSRPAPRAESPSRLGRPTAGRTPPTAPSWAPPRTAATSERAGASDAADCPPITCCFRIVSWRARDGIRSRLRRARIRRLICRFQVWCGPKHWNHLLSVNDVGLSRCEEDCAQTKP